MASETVSSSINWNALASTKAYNDAITINGGATLTLDQSVDAQGILDATAGVTIACTSGFSKFRIANNSSTVALIFRGRTAGGAMNFTSGCSLEVEGGYIEIYTSDGTASQSTSGWTGAGYAAADEPGVIEVETGSGTGVYERWHNLGDLLFSDVGVGELGKWFKFNNSTGAISFGDGGASTAGKGGAIPPNGSKVRVYNIGIGGATNSPSTHTPIIATGGATSNFQLTCDSGGIISLSKCYFFGCYANLERSRQVTIADVGHTIPIRMANNKNLTIDRLGSGVNRYFNAVPLVTQTCQGTTLGEVTVVSKQQSPAWTITSMGGCTFNTPKAFVLKRTGSAVTFDFLSSPGVVMNNPTTVGGKVSFNTSSNPRLNSLRMSDSPHSAVYGGSYPTSAIHSFGNSTGLYINGWDLIPDGKEGVCPAFEASFDAVVVDSDYPSGTSYYAVCVDGHQHKRVRSTTTGGYQFEPSVTTKGLTLQDTEWGAAGIGAITAALMNVTPSGLTVKNCDASAVRTASGVQDSIFWEIRTHKSNNEGLMGLSFCPQSSGKSYYAITGTSIAFGGDGNLYFRQANSDNIVYTWPHKVLAISAFRNVAPTLDGSNTSNILVEFSIDKNDGNGYSAYAELTAANLSALTGVSATTGFYFRIRISRRSGTGSSDNCYLTNVTWATTNDRSVQYPLDLVSVTIRNLKDGARYWLKNEDTGEVLALGTKSGGDGDVTVENVPYDGVEQGLTLKVRDYRTTGFYLPVTMQGVLTENGADFYVSQIEDALAS